MENNPNVQLLKKLGLWEKFKRNFENQNCGSYHLEDHIEWGRDSSFHKFCITAFRWDNTPEGGNFWEHVATKEETPTKTKQS